MTNFMLFKDERLRIVEPLLHFGSQRHVFGANPSLPCLVLVGKQLANEPALQTVAFQTYLDNVLYRPCM